MHVQTYENFLNEGWVSFEGMKFMSTIFNDPRGMAIQFMPDSKTLDKFSKNEQVETVLARLKKNMPEFASTLWHEQGNQAAGLIFRVDIFELNDIIIKAIK